ncbi:hypothetical protein GCM10008944_30010 [Cytobacillus oceanisediminis]
MRRLVLAAVSGLVGSLIVAVPLPASAATGVSISAGTVAVQASGSQRFVEVFARCLGSMTCSGKATFEGSGAGTARYSIKGGKSAYVTVPWSNAATDQPTGVGPGEVRPATLAVDPSNKAVFRRTMTLEKRIASRKIVGTVTGSTDGVTHREVTLWTVSGLRTTRTKAVEVASDGSFDLGSFGLGRNNAPGQAYRLSLSATVDGSAREWFWRGGTSGSGAFTGGGRTIRESGIVRVQKGGDFKANFAYGTVTGSLTGTGANNAEVRIVSPSAVKYTRASDLRGLDVPYCGNEFGDDQVSGGQYQVRFVPRPDGGTQSFMVAFEPTGSQRGAVIVDGGDVVDSCHKATGYVGGSSRLLGFGGASTKTVPAVTTDQDETELDVSLTSSFSLNGSDRWVTLREYAPGRKALDSPIVAAKRAGTDKKATFTGLRPGKYVFESGRRTSCSGWFRSIYPDNYLYHKGLERQSERWKTIKGKYGSRPYNVISRQNGYVPQSPGKGYKGWMYRPVCTTVTSGAQKIVDVGDSPGRTSMSLSKGATISGRITRVGGKSNKEILVTAYASDGTRVLRSAFSDRSGRFTIRGLASGKYKIVVNGDSWRGIGRTHKGAHSKTVKAGRSYSVGTLNFRS